jgi:DNA-binding response OmpR family regulator
MDQGMMGECKEMMRGWKEAPQKSGRNALSIIASTHCENAADILTAFAAGADDYIVKPFDPEVMYSKLYCLGLVRN